MKITIIANISANGKVLLTENTNHQVPQEPMGIFMEVANQAGNLVVGEKSFELFQQFPGGVKSVFPNVEMVSLSVSNTMVSECKVVESQEESINYLKGKGYTLITIGSSIS